jgi:hypothetical protein
LRVVERAESIEVTNANGGSLAYVYFEDEDGRRALMKAETRGRAQAGDADCPASRAQWTSCRRLRAARDEPA